MAFAITEEVLSKLSSSPDFYCVYATDKALVDLATKTFLLSIQDDGLLVSEISLKGNIKSQKSIPFSEIEKIDVMDEFMLRSFKIMLKNGTACIFWANKKVSLKLRNQSIKQKEYIDRLTNELKDSLCDKIIHKQMKKAAVGTAILFSTILVIVSAFVGLFVYVFIYDETRSHIWGIISGLIVFGLLWFCLNRVIDLFYKKFSINHKPEPASN